MCICSANVLIPLAGDQALIYMCRAWRSSASSPTHMGCCEQRRSQRSQASITSFTPVTSAHQTSSRLSNVWHPLRLYAATTTEKPGRERFPGRTLTIASKRIYLLHNIAELEI